MSWLTSSMPNDSMHMLTHRLLYTILNLYLCIWIPLLSDLQTMNQTYIFPLYNSHTLFTHARDGACFVLCIYVFCYHLFILCRCSMYHCFDWQPQDCASQGQRVATIREEMIKNLRYAVLNILCAFYWIYINVLYILVWIHRLRQTNTMFTACIAATRNSKWLYGVTMLHILVSVMPLVQRLFSQ